MLDIESHTAGKRISDRSAVMGSRPPAAAPDVALLAGLESDKGVLAHIAVQADPHGRMVARPEPRQAWTMCTASVRTAASGSDVLHKTLVSGQPAPGSFRVCTLFKKKDILQG